jgi:hypothetical protein
LERPLSLPRDVEAANPNLTSSRPDLAEHHANGGALPGAIMAQQTVNLTGCDVQGEIVHCQVLAEFFLNLVEPDHGTV